MKKPTILQMLSLDDLCPFSMNLSLLLAKFIITNPVINKMKNRFLSHAFALVGILFFMTHSSYGQNLKSFDIRFDRNVKGDQLLIGNNILSVNNNDFNDNGVYNSDVDMQYVDIDGDASTFSSSSAVLTIPNSNAPGTPCYKIAYAALYWSAIIRDGDNSLDRTKFTTIKFKTPVGGYNTITGQLIYDAINQTDGIGASKNRPYACYADVTSLVQPLANANGTYTVANVLSSVGKNGSTGLSAGWSLYIVYEDPNLPARSITSYDGFSGIGGATTLDINVTGFRTIPAGPVNASFAFAALEGDKAISGDYLQINSISQSAATSTGTTLRSSNNFFNSSITYIDPVTKATADFTSPNRTPASSNTLGYDTGIITIKNDNNSAIGNNVTSAKITLGSTQDVYFYYFNAIAVEIIEPKIILTKAVKDGAGNPANNTPVGLGAILKYELQFQNVGNDNAKNFTITDVLPANTNFVYPTDIEQVPTGVTHTYNAATRTITFTVPDNLVLKNGSKSVPIRFKVQVVPTCANLAEPCNNIIKNTARSKYTGQINTNGGLGFGEDSYASFSACTISVPESTNFLVGVDDCKKRNDVLCGDNLTISATGGYASYSWSTSPTGTPVIGTSQTLTVTKPGKYYVKNTATPPCVDLEEIITVADYAAKPANPLIQYADNKNPATGLIDQCVNDGSVLPKIFLCGQSASKLLDLSSLGATKITWETTTCLPDPNLSDLCANVSPTCTWTTAAPDGNTFTANASGQYRVSIYFGGCFSRFYFNVYKNPLNPTATKKDMICGNNGSITINGVGAGYEYSLTKTSGYQSSNTFSIATAGTYTVYIRQVGVVTNPCIFEVSGIQIYKIDFNPIAPFITQPLCHNSKGSIKVYGTAYNGAQYTYELFKGGTSIEKVINSTASEYEFTNKDAGDYTYTVSTLDGCSYNGVAKIISPAALTASPAITKPLTCTNGEITVTPSNGTAPFYYYVNGSTTGQTDPKIVITTAGTYAIKVVDKNNCEFNIPPITINANPKPNFSLTSTNILCYGANTGEIKFNVTNANGYTLAYSINNGVNYVTNGTFSNLPPGTYTPVLKYSLSGVDCFETRPNIIITQPAEAVTASMGVSELAGCGPGREGRVRITNPQGGVAPYQYSFDNQATWITVNDAYKAPGTYTLYVKDANGCIFSASVTIDPEPAAPQIDVNTPVDFNCDGTATSTVTVTNPGGSTYTYDYYLDGTKNTNVPSNVFLNVSPGSHAIKVDYKLNTVPTFSNLLYENFGYGDDTTSPGMNATYYCFERQVAATQCRGSFAINDGDYSVTARIVAPFGAWLQPGDHTPPTVPPTPKGRCLVVNIGSEIPVTEILYEKVINNIIPNQPITFEFFAINLVKKGFNIFDPDLRVALVDATGTEISWYNTGNIPKSEQWEYYPKTAITLDPKSNTTLKFIVRSNVRQTSGNDVAIDDIKVFQLPRTCTTTKDFTIVVPTGKAFTSQISGNKSVTCNGESNGEITIAAQNFDPIKGFEYSKDNGVTWQTSTTSPVKLTSLGAALYKVVVRPVGATVTTCSKPFDVTISAPPTLTLSASETKKATCTTGATITAVAGGGTPAYQYELRQGAVVIVPFTNNGGVFTNVLAGNYTVFVKDANSCSNPVGVGVSVTAVPAISAAVVPSTAMCFDPTTGAKINVAITGGVAPYSYQTSLNGGTFSASSATFTTPSFTHTAAVTGNYVFRVTDSNGCSFDTTQQVINAKVTANASVTTDLDCDVAPGSPDAVITGTISGGTAPFTVVLTSGQTTGTLAGPVGTATTFTYTTGVSGTYQFEITDAIGCKTTTSATINAKVAVTGNAVVTNETCETLNNGSVTLQALTGVAPFTYNFNNLGFSGAVTYGSLSGSVAGTSYPYQIRDNKGCIYDGTAVVFEPTPITLSASITTPYTCTTNATITASASNGNGGFTYVLRRGATTVATNTTGIFPNLTVAGSYTVTATDAKGCSLTSSPAMVIDALTPPTKLDFTEKPITCKSTELTSEVTISVTGGKGNLKYEITAPAAAIINVSGATTGIFTGLTAGASGTTYAFKVTDENNCSVTGTYTVKDVLPVIVNGSLVANVTCKTATDGKLKFTVSGNAGTFTYELRNSLNVVVPIAQSTQTGNVIDYIGLAADTYTLTVTNPSTECKATKVLKVDAPSVALSFNAPTISPFTCNPLTRASVTINTTGGWGSNRYTLTLPDGTTVVGPQTSAIFANLTQSGLYTIAVTDLSGNGCTITDTFTIAPYTTLSVSATVNGQCTATGSSFQIVAAATGGSGAYTYSINTGVVPSPADTFTVAPGTYTITVRDALGCTAPVVVTVNEVLTAAAVRTKELDCTTTPNATIRIDAFGGKPAYNYEVSFNGGLYGAPVAPATIVGNVFTTSVAGTYKFRITDSNLPTACTAETNNVVISPIVYPVILNLAEKQSIKCNGDATGIIEVTIDPSKGVGPFKYSIDGITYQNSNQFTGLIAGTYTITVKDNKDCTFTYPTPIVIDQPDAITFVLDKKDITCNNPGGTSLGEIKVLNVQGGTATSAAPFRYFITNNFGDVIAGNPYTASTTGREDHIFTVINFGVYTVNVVDANGCSLSKQITIASPPEDLDINVTTLSSNCTTGGTAIVKAISVVGSGNYEFGILETNTSPYTTTWYTPDVVGGDTKTFTNLTPGVTYTFVVHDLTTLCYYVKSADQPIAPASTLTSTVTPKNVTCKGNNDGKVTFTIDNFDATTTSIDYQLYTSFSNVAVGSSFNVPVTFGTPVTVANFSPIAGTLAPGSYYIRFIENGTGSFNGCKSASKIFEIKESSVDLSVSASVIKNENCNQLGIINALAKDGAGTYRYIILPSTSAAPTASDPAWDTTSTFNVAAGSYLVYAKDANGCIKVTPATIDLIKDPSPVIALSVIDNCAVEGAYSVEVDLTSPGVGPYTISVNGASPQNVGSFPYTVSGLSSGPQNIIVYDANGCPSNSPALTLHKKLSVIAERTKELDCTTSPDGLITVTVSDGLFTASDATPDFRYEVSIDGAPYLAPVNFANDVRVLTYPVTTAGTYQFRITDLNNCTVESTVVDIAVKVIPTATATVTQPTCVGVADGSIKINATLGVLPYKYSIDGGANWQDSNEFTGLAAGTVNYIVRDAKLCLFNDSEDIINPTPVVASLASISAFTCSPTNTPNVTVVTVSAAGGAGNYSFSADGIHYFPSNSIPADNKYAFDVIDTSAPSVKFYTKDANGCTDDIVVPIAPFPKLISAKATLGTRADCNTPTEIINVAITGGATPTNFSYQVAIDGGAYGALTPITAGATSFTYPATSIGSFYEFKITDNTTGCSIISNAYTVPVFNTMTLTASVAANVDCATNATGAIEINIGNYTGPYTYEIFNGAVTTGFTGTGNTTTNPLVLPHGLVAGNNYTVVVTQTAYPSCIKSSNTVIITEPAALDLSGPFVTVKNQNCNTTGAVVTVDDTKISGGKRDYTYVFVRNGTGALPPAGDFKPLNTATFATTQIAPSTETVEVWVKDANGCTEMKTVTISLDPAPTVTASAASQCPSPTGYTIIAAGAGGVGTLEYSLDGNSFQTPSSLTVTAPGNYTIWVRDANGCKNQTATPVTIFEPLQLQADVTTLSTCLNADGVVTLTASGGSIPANYQYSNDGTTYGSSNVFGGLAASATPYTFYVRDITTGCVKSVDVIMLLPNTAIDFVPVATPVTCNGGSDGTITVNMTTPTLTVNNNPIYTYALTGSTTVGNNPVIRPKQDSPLFSGLKAGTYIVTVTSGRGCSVPETIVVDEPDPILVPTPTVVPFGCTAGNAGNLATITVTGVTGGSNTYLQYEFIKVGNPIPVQKSDNPIYIEEDFSGGSYIVNVYDNKGCKGTSTTPIIIAPYVQLDKVNVNVTRPITCLLSENITVSATTIGTGATDLEYSLVDIDASTGTQGTLYPKQTNKTGNFSNLPVGNYFITVKNLLTNCEIIGVHYVNEPNTFDLTIDNVVDVKCLGGADGSAKVTLIDRVITAASPNQAGAFTYTIIGPSPSTGNATSAGPINLTNLAAGTYTITATLTNTPFCTVSKNFTITGPNVALAIDKSFTAITCVTGNNDGSISATASGGWPGGYEFQLERGATVVTSWSSVSDFNGLIAGNYVVKVRDSRGCEVFTTVDLSNPTPIAFNAIPSTTLLTCKGDTSATITVSAPTGGQGTNYLYTLNTTSVTPRISSGPQADPVFTNLGAGTYTVTVTDGWGCGTTSTTPIVITEPTEVVPTLVLTTTQTCLTLSTITLRATGGTGAYQYSTSPTSGFVAMGGNSITFTVPVGTYRYYVRDANGCTSVVSNDITIEPLPTLKVDINSENAKINCKGDANGVIVANATGGLGNYVYTLLDGVGGALGFTPVQTTPGNFTQLPAGTYKVRVDSGDCNVVSTDIVTITEPLVPVTATAVPTPVTCNGAANGIITVTASGGTGAMKYA
ncbi:SprB repeat-containing protein, partial [Flavobacterium succinicans]|uniref:SprB repeat-containing protein n=1 Tax=Flavobacterium succinicans TaxID=29536 RepID=UPI0007E55C42